MSARFKREAGTIFTRAFVNDSILIFREMKKKPPMTKRKMSISLQSNQNVNSVTSEGDPMNRTNNSNFNSPNK